MSDLTVNQVQENKPSDKELNFRALEAKYQKELAAERTRREEIERAYQEAQARKSEQEEDDDEPYVNPKKLDKKLNNFGKQTQSEIQKSMEATKAAVKQELKQEMWLDKHPDFYDTMKYAQKLYETDQELAETILEMPEGFERQKLVYKNIKALGLDKPAPKQPSIQEKIDSNRKSPYYQPSGVGSAPYASAGDFSASGQKNAYDKMQELKNRLRI